MKKFLSIWLLIILSQVIFPQDSYYNGIDPNRGSFITDLHNLIFQHTKISYDQFDETNVANFASRDTSNGKKVVTCVYTGQNYVYSPPFTWVEFSREHTWCHSWMPTYNSESGPEYSDQHHIFPTNQNFANGRRSNYPLGNVVTVSYQYLEGKLGKDISGNTVYEPRNGHKGDAARALFYMSVCYDGSGGRWYLPSFQDQEVLKEWSENDPPDAWEIARNDFIYSLQKNRNPFVDHPEWVNLINFYTLTYLGSIVNLAAEPTNYLTDLTLESVTGNYILLSWSDALPATQIPAGYFIIANTSNIFTDPVDGNEFTEDLNLEDGSAVIKVDYSGQNFYSFNNLNPSATYYFRIYSFNGTGTQINYKTDGSVPSITVTTAAQGNSSVLLSQDWTDTNLITVDDDWSDVQNIIGYRGDNLTSASGVDPQTVLSDGTSTPVDVNANQTDPKTFISGGVTEFELENPVIALNGSGTADAPFLLITLNTTGYTSINLSYIIRDIDGSTDNSIQQVALQYRVGTSGNFTNLPEAYIADATEAGTDTLVTKINILLPEELNNQVNIQLRIITTNAAGNDETIGIDDILINGITENALADEPANYASSFSVSPKNSSTVTISWTDALEGNQVPSGYLLLVNNSNSFTTPVDGIFYTDDTDLSDGSGVINIPYSTLNEFELSPLIEHIDYYFRFYSYNGTGNTINYKTDGNVPSSQININLPVELISFTGEVMTGIVKLIWKTATETNNQGFSIERKINSSGSNIASYWQEIGFVNGYGSVSNSHSYSFIDKSLPGNGKYLYRLKQIDYNGSVNYSYEVQVEINNKINFSLEQNYPNPFNPVTIINWSIPEAGKVTLKIYDAIGNEVTVLADEVYQAGMHSTPVKISMELSSGIYYYKLTAGSFTAVKKMILLR